MLSGAALSNCTILPLKAKIVIQGKEVPQLIDELPISLYRRRPGGREATFAGANCASKKPIALRRSRPQPADYGRASYRVE